ncbi:phosphotransferase [Kribbella sp. NPDC049174]|uniref:phosphotransferase n=1 Tax=Kribbella sp. NPDC049174 TaxID=3364112 RepID=UPI003710554C
MREAPEFISADAVLDAVRTHWAIDVDVIEHLPVGFGAHHWRVSFAGAPRLFVTLDNLGPRHTAESLEAAYTAAGELAAAGLEFVLASVPNRQGRYTAPLAGHRLSCVPWTGGKPGSGPIDTDDLAQQNAKALAQLHATPPPIGIPSWQPRVGEDFGGSLANLVRTPWQTGPYGERARSALTQRIDAIRRWTDTYHDLSRRTVDHQWVPTHGEPHTANQLITDHGIVFVDWESLALAPRERDLGTLINSGYADLAAPNWEMTELFDLEWRLSELAEYATWFTHPHTGTASDRSAFDDLITELHRPDWTRPPTDPPSSPTPRSPPPPPEGGPLCRPHARNTVHTHQPSIVVPSLSRLPRGHCRSHPWRTHPQHLHHRPGPRRHTGSSVAYTPSTTRAPPWPATPFPSTTVTHDILA